jgi:methionyl-tRNA formyltransferase
MRIIFAGTPEFARVALQAMCAAGHEVALVLTQPDRPGGRGMKLLTSPVKQFALANSIAVCQPRSLRLDGKYPGDAQTAQAAIASVRADVMVVAAYGLILPAWVLQAFKHGCLNIHASLLPRWRGAAPIHRAIEAGDLQTGITIMQMDEGLDTGDTLLMETTAIQPTDTTGSVHDRLATLGGELILPALEQAGKGLLQARRQPSDPHDAAVTYAAKVDKTEALIDWALPAESIVRRVRAFNPTPGASSRLHGDVLKIWQAEAWPGESASSGKPFAGGQIVRLSTDGIAIAAMNSIVNITELQKPGGRRLGAADFLRGTSLHVGDCFSFESPV